jgi:hypothetical protein
VAAVSPEGGQGLESPPHFARADSHGPRVTASKPAVGATGVPVNADVHVFLDEPADSSLVTSNTIKMYAGGGRVGGRVFVVTNRHLVFDPARLTKGVSYRVVVRELRDRLGNVGPREQWGFATVEPPSRKRDRDRRR